MAEVFVAQYGERDIQTPIGVYDTLEKAKMAVIASRPEYHTVVEVFDTVTGDHIKDYIYHVRNKDWREYNV